MTRPGGRFVPRAGVTAWLARSLGTLRATPWYPTAFASGLVLAFHMASGVHLFASLRALVLAALAVALLQLTATAVLRDRHRAALLITVVLVVTFGWQALVLVALVPQVRWYLLLFLPSAALLAAALLRRRRDPASSLFDATRASLLLGRLPPALIAAVLFFGLTTGALAQDVRDLGLVPDGAVARAQASADGAPDIWLILLDGHARHDTLERLFAYDDGPFLEALAARGLDVSPRSRSNYTLTELTLPSLFHMVPLDRIEALAPLLSDREARVQPTLRSTLNRNPVFDLLRGRGYEIVTSAPPYEDVTLRSADRYLDDGQVNEFELHLMRSTLLLDLVDRLAPDLLSEQHRQRLLSAYRHVELESARSVPFPRFEFIHVVGPHMPAVFDADGSPVRAPNTFNWYSDTIVDRDIDAAEFARQYIGQLRYLDELTVAAVERIVSADPQAVVIVFSDHGSRSRLDIGHPERSDFDEALATLFAARTPGHEDLFPDTITLVNLFPILFNAYFGLDLPTSPDRTYTPADGPIFQLHEVPSPDAGT